MDSVRKGLEPLKQHAKLFSSSFFCSGLCVTKSHSDKAAMTESGSEQSWLFWRTVGILISVTWLTLRVWMILMAACIYRSPNMGMRSFYNLKSGWQDLRFGSRYRSQWVSGENKHLLWINSDGVHLPTRIPLYSSFLSCIILPRYWTSFQNSCPHRSHTHTHAHTHTRPSSQVTVIIFKILSVVHSLIKLSHLLHVWCMLMCIFKKRYAL